MQFGGGDEIKNHFYKRANVYAKTREECEEKLAVMIEEVKRELAAQKARSKKE